MTPSGRPSSSGVRPTSVCRPSSADAIRSRPEAKAGWLPVQPTSAPTTPSGPSVGGKAVGTGKPSQRPSYQGPSTVGVPSVSPSSAVSESQGRTGGAGNESGRLWSGLANHKAPSVSGHEVNKRVLLAQMPRSPLMPPVRGGDPLAREGSDLQDAEAPRSKHGGVEAPKSKHRGSSPPAPLLPKQQAAPAPTSQRRLEPQDYHTESGGYDSPMDGVDGAIATEENEYQDPMMNFEGGEYGEDFLDEEVEPEDDQGAGLDMELDPTLNDAVDEGEFMNEWKLDEKDEYDEDKDPDVDVDTDEGVRLKEAEEAVENSLRLKRAMSARGPSLEDPTGKRRRLENGSGQHVQSSDRPLARALLGKWRLDADRATKYVLKLASSEELQELRDSRFMPRRGHKKSNSEQVYDMIIQARERLLPPSGALDGVAAFLHKWKLDEESEQVLRDMDHLTLQIAFRYYDGTKPLLDALNEGASTDSLWEDGTGHVALDRPGSLTLSRSNRLELMDPFADALVLGDANLSFSLQLSAHRKMLHHTGRTVATTFEKIETLRERYREIDDTVSQLQRSSSKVLHDVDCTRLAVDTRFQGMEGKFGAVYYNFPHAGVVTGFYDGHPFVRWRHANLMHLFFRALRAFVKTGGSVKVSSNSRATGVRYSDIIAAAESNEFRHVETFPFLEWQLSGYRRSYGDRRDSGRRPEDGEVYRAQKSSSDMVYCFRYMPTGKALPESQVIYPPSKLDLFLASEGRMPDRGTLGRKRRVEELYKLFLSYVEGVHVG
eukprot:TRINITY_DN17210_c0_g1_i1.p1 TRINITY_DN17210_c0_g1~~TRINITY_DN17210_c0_g1_i1.p1  ORF type:complete len:772 (+),score=118.90 TRINITY_DN17210_c0_g1_i1:58-2373(+)